MSKEPSNLERTQYDVIVIGGGPSGLMASISAATHGASVLLVDKGGRLGRKLGISGGGRCNVTNAKEVDELIKHIPGNGRFLYSAFHHFNNRDIIDFFEGLGIALKEEDRGRMFPVSDKAKTVVQALISKARDVGVQMMTHAPVQQVRYVENQVDGVLLKNGKVFSSPSVVLATGGKSVPHTGSTGDGFPWAEAAGHRITELYPTEVPLVSHEPWIQQKMLQGLSLRNIELTVWSSKNKKIISHEGDMIFTHFGLSGPAALRCSQFVVKELKKTGLSSVRMSIDLFPEQSTSELETDWTAWLSKHPKKSLKNSLREKLPDRLLPLMLEMSDISDQVTYYDLPKKAWQKFIALCKAFPVQVHGTLSLKEAFVTGGGIHLKEVDPKTMQSKIMPGLFFCGEILDVHGYTGGYNITAAFVTGYTAGKHAAESRDDA